MIEKEILETALQLLKEGKWEEYLNFLIENFRVFPREIQKEILANIIEAYLLKETERLKIVNEKLEEILSKI